MTEQQHSPEMLHSLQNILIEGNSQSIALFKLALDAILELGEQEHTGDWDPYLKIQLRNTQEIRIWLRGIIKPPAALLKNLVIETETGYPEITFGDFNDEEQKDYMKHIDEITSIIVYIPNPDNEEEPLELCIPISCITFISVQR